MEGAGRHAVLVRVQGPDPKGTKRDDQSFSLFDAGITTLSASGLIVSIGGDPGVATRLAVLTTANTLRPFLIEEAQRSEPLSPTPAISCQAQPARSSHLLTAAYARPQQRMGGAVWEKALCGQHFQCGRARGGERHAGRGHAARPGGVGQCRVASGLRAGNGWWRDCGERAQRAALAMGWLDGGGHPHQRELRYSGRQRRRRRQQEPLRARSAGARRG
jgi:hypothetical protein|eukprot:SAG25_NODE_62_length_17948_cov_8.453975_6_plen_218_part_00